MHTKLIELNDGLRVEVAADEDAVQQISAGAVDRVDHAIDGAQSLLKIAVQPVAFVWDELNQDLAIEQVEIELALGFEVVGNLFVACGAVSANINFRPTMSLNK